jgi:hypothetical protein
MLAHILPKSTWTAGAHASQRHKSRFCSKKSNLGLPSNSELRSHPRQIGQRMSYDRLLADLTYFGLTGPRCLSVDIKRGILYVGLSWGQIAWFTIKYDYED